MSSMSELRNYKAAEKSLSDRLDFLRKQEALALKNWQDNRGSTKGGPSFDLWTKAIERANETEQALTLIGRIIREIEGN